MMLETILKAALCVTAFTGFSLFCLLVIQRYLKRRFDPELHHVVLTILILQPVILILACLPAYIDIGSIGNVVPSVTFDTAVSIDRPFHTDGPSLATNQTNWTSHFYIGLFFLWGFVAGWKFFQVAVDLRALSTLRIKSHDVCLPNHIKLSRLLPLMKSSQASSPMLVGFFRPFILMPHSIDYDDSTWAILEHEIAHADRYDNWVTLILRVYEAVFWWNLPAYALRNILFQARERICDRQSARITGNPHSMARGLLNVAAGLSELKGVPLTSRAYSLALPERISELLKEDILERRMIKVPLWAALLSIGAFCIVLTPRFGVVEARLSVPVKNQNHSPEQAILNQKLYNAARSKDALLVNQLLIQGANPNISEDGNAPAIIMAARTGRADIVRLMIAFGASPNIEYIGDGTPLIAAVMSGDLATVDLLLRAGADQDAYVFLDETPLITASRQGRFEIAKRLIAAGANPSLTVKSHSGDKGGPYRSPLSEAKRNNHSRITNHLLSLGAQHLPPVSEL